MASDGTRVFVLGGELSPDAQVDESKLIHVLDTSMYFILPFHLDSPHIENTELLDYPGPDSDAVDPSDKTTQLVQKSSATPLTRGQLHQPLSSSSDAHAAHGASPFQKATPEELEDPTSQPSRLPWRPTGASGGPRRVPEGK